MDLIGLAGILAALLGLALTVYGVFFNGRATRALVRQIQASAEAGHRDTLALLEAIRSDVQAVQGTTQAIQGTTQAIQGAIQAIHQNGQRRHDDLVAYIQDMDRRHTEILAAIVKRA